jgi:predicted RNA polymerase sigma factor
VVLYEALGRVAPSPVVELNRAVAVAMASGPSPRTRQCRAPASAQALAIVDELIALDRLPGSHLVLTVRGELLARLGRRPEARAELQLPARLCTNQRDCPVLLCGRAGLTSSSAARSIGAHGPRPPVQARGCWKLGVVQMRWAR